ncbi:MAG: polymer-forming cytoskeletal protein [Hyphomicrobiales bacterium]|nr:MAG: polymer-forming cytoskeletal protein [Hyphomicrobiales bacterium]
MVKALILQSRLADRSSTACRCLQPEGPPAMNSAASYTNFNRKVPAPSRSVIDAWLQIAGNLRTEGEILVEGKIVGDIRCALLIVAVDAEVTGTIVAEEVMVYGKIKGNIRATKITLKDTAVVDSDIVHRVLSIERGACFDGSVLRRDQPLAEDADRQIEGLKAAAGAMHRSADNSHDADDIGDELLDEAAA